MTCTTVLTIMPLETKTQVYYDNAASSFMYSGAKFNSTRTHGEINVFILHTTTLQCENIGKKTDQQRLTYRYSFNILGNERLIANY